MLASNECRGIFEAAKRDEAPLGFDAQHNVGRDCLGCRRMMVMGSNAALAQQG
jgi:hypothetical protein